MKEKLKKCINYFEEIFAGTFLIITTVLVIINVFLRYFMNTGLYWSEEVATGCFVWAVFLGASAGYKRKMHVGINMITNALKPTLRAIVIFLVDIILLFINGYIFIIALEYLKISSRKPTPVLGISSAFISSAILVSFFLMSLYTIGFLITDGKKILKKGDR